MRKQRSIIYPPRIIVLILILLIAFTSCRENSAGHHFRNGTAKYKLGNYVGAIEDFSKSIAIRDDFTEAYYLKAICESKLKMYDKALHDFNKALELDPDYYDALFNRAFYVKEQTGDYKGAIEDYERYLELQPDRHIPFAYNNMGFAKYKLGRTEEALNDINRSISLDPGNPYAYRNKGIILFELDSPREACKHFEKALELGYNHEFDTAVEEIYFRNCK